MFGYFKLKSGYQARRDNHLPVPREPKVKSNEATKLLASHGFEIAAAKHRVPVRLKVDGQSLHSRFFIDYFVEKDHQWYVVKVENPRQPFEWTGSAIRKTFYPYLLQFPGAAGLVVVRMQTGDLKLITYDED
jgi:hypothetical protein